MGFAFKTTPFAHQLTEFEQHCHTPARMLAWEQGTGKTKPIIDTAAYLFVRSEINGLLVIAPNGVHRNWISDEIPAHMPDAVLPQTQCHIWYSTDRQSHRKSFEAILRHRGLAVLTMSHPAVLTPRGQDAWKRFLQQRRCLYVLDESQRVKNPNAKTSKRILGSHVAAPFRRCLSGTPVDNSPFDLYNQLRFLDPDIWKRMGLHTFAMFKQHFGVWETWQSANGTFPKCVAYRNLPQLHAALTSLGSRITKDEVLPNLPAKLYSKRYVELTAQQQRVYKQLTDDLIAEMDSGVVTAALAITRLLRFQQVVCGYLPASDDDPTLVDIPGGNPRLECLAELCEDLGHKAIVWARFRRDIQLISQHPVFRDRCVVVDGSVTGEARGEALDKFQKGDTQFLIGNPAAISTGVTLHSAKTVIYYSNSFKLSDRLQSEDRAHRIGTRHAVHYVDLVAPDTVDERIVDSLRQKVNVAATITGDTLREWI